MKHIGMILAAPASGSGKTTITIAFLAALKKRGVQVRSFKCGPDYIDPMYHEQVIGVPSENLDTFFSGAEEIRLLYQRNQEKYDCSLIEGVMGLYDGLGGTRTEGSAYHLAQTLDLPVFLILDAKGMGRTMIALLAGILQYDRDHRIAGIILNRTTERFYKVMKPAVEKELGLPVLGFFPEKKELRLESRHLGLKLPAEIRALQEQVMSAAEFLEKTVDVDRLLQKAAERNSGEQNEDDIPVPQADYINHFTISGKKVRIAVAKDPAFCFYYKENLRLLQEMGAELVEFSPLADLKLPDHVAGLLLGGGYPELYAEKLAENASMRRSIREAIAAGMPSVAECGGFMYLHENLTDEKGCSYPMVGVIPGDCHNRNRLVRFGYVEIREQEPHFLGGMPIRGHEFHYYDSDCSGSSCRAVKPVTGTGWDCVHVAEDHWWGFPHLYYPSNPAYVSSFLNRCRKL